MKPVVITKVTGHVATIALAGDLRYLDETRSRGDWQFKPLSPEEIKALVGKNRRLFAAEPDGPIVRIPPQTLPTGRSTGTISEAYAAQVERMRTVDKKKFTSGS